MPWTIRDVDRFNRGLTARKKRQWVSVANSVLAKCLKDGGNQSTCEASAIRQANGAVKTQEIEIMSEKDIELLEVKISSFIKLLQEEHPQLESWEYLVHHIHIDENGKEEIHHCYMICHLGNLYEIKHIKDENGKIRHCLVGLKKDQDIYWSEEEAKADGNKVPCANRQLEGEEL